MELMMKLVITQCLVVLCFAQNFDFFYFVQQSFGSLCNLKQPCCYPNKVKPPSDFGIHGLWPNNKDGTFPAYCPPATSLDPSMISDLRSVMQKEWPSLACPSGDSFALWSHEWSKHGTCSQSVLKQHDYCKEALQLKNQINLLQKLESAGINPDGKSYSLASIKAAIKQGTGYNPSIDCNVNRAGGTQLYQVYMCVDKSGTKLMDCPFVRKDQKCGSSPILFPIF